MCVTRVVSALLSHYYVVIGSRTDKCAGSSNLCIAKCECLIVEGDREAGGEGETTQQGLLVQTTNHRQLESGHGGGEEAVPGH